MPDTATHHCLQAVPSPADADAPRGRPRPRPPPPPAPPPPRCPPAAPALAYADAHAAIAWLVDALGADARTVHTDPSGRTVVHAELWFGDACVMLGTMRGEALPPSRP